MRTTRTLPAPKRQAPVQAADPNLLPSDPRRKPAPPYVFVHYEDAWRFDDTHGWIPQLSKLLAKPGTNGTDRRMDLTKAIQGVAAKGGLYINPKDRRLMKEGEDEEDALFFDYARFYTCTNGAKWWVEPGMNPTVTRSGSIIWSDDENARVMAEFSAHLRDAGIVDPMHALTYATKMDSARARLENIRGRVGRNPHLSAELVAAEKRVEAMAAAWEKQLTAELVEAAPMPKPRRKRS